MVKNIIDIIIMWILVYVLNSNTGTTALLSFICLSLLCIGFAFDGHRDFKNIKKTFK